MIRINETLARYAGPIVLTVGALLATGAVLTTVGLAVVGWSIYSIGYAGSLVAFPALVALGRRPLGVFGRSALAMLLTGVVLGLPVMAMVWGFYAQNLQVHDLFMPYAMTPFGMIAAPLAWAGLALFGVAGIRDHSLPVVSGALFAIAPVLAIPVDFGILPQAAWAAAFVAVSTGLAWVVRGSLRHPVTVPA